jgi:HlyD family secretion protein
VAFSNAAYLAGREKILKICQRALFTPGQGWSVVAIEGGRAKRRDFEISQRNQTDAEILNGMSVGDDVIRHPSNQLLDDLSDWAK